MENKLKLICFDIVNVNLLKLHVADNCRRPDALRSGTIFTKLLKVKVGITNKTEFGGKVDYKNALLIVDDYQATV